MHKITKFLSLILYFFAFSTIVLKAQISFKYLTKSDGVNAVNPRGVAIDNLGFIWLAHQEGLLRYSGQKSFNYTNSENNAARRLDFADCRQVFFLKNIEKIYAIGSEFVINVINPRTAAIEKRIPLKRQDNSEWITNSIQTEKQIYILSNINAYTFDINTNELSQINITNDKIKNDRINTIAENDNQIWIPVDNEGLIVYDIASKSISNTFTLSQLGITTNDVRFKGIMVTNNTVVLSYNNGAEKYKRADKNKLLKDNSKTITSLKNTKFFKTTDQYWFLNDGVATCKMQNFSDIKTIDVLKIRNTIYTSITQVNQHNFALTDGKGLLIMGDNNFINSFKNNAEKYEGKLQHLFGISTDDNKNLTIASANGIYTLNEKGINPLSANTTFYGAHKLDSGTYYFSGPQEQYVLNNNTTKRDYLDLLSKEHSTLQVNRIVDLNPNITLICSENDNGIIWLNKQENTLKTINEQSAGLQLKTNSVNAVVAISAEKAAVLSDYYVCILDFVKNETKYYQIDNPLNSKSKIGLFFDMVFANGKFWIAAYGNGIIVLDQNMQLLKIINTSNGLSNNGVYRIFAKNGNVFISSNDGITIINDQTYVAKRYYQEDGLNGNVFEEGCGFQNDSLIYFGGIEGLSIINTNKYIVNSTTPTLYLQNIIIETNSKIIDTFNIDLTQIEIPNNYKQLKINFYGQDTLRWNKIKYEYRILELGKEWIDLSNETTITLLGISHGNYNLEIRALNEDLIASNILKLKLKILPKWYQTMLFKSLIIMSLLGIGYLIYKIRITQIIKEQKIKTALASDLHDELGSSLTGLKIYAYQLKKNPQYISNLEEGITDSIKSVREMIWQLNEEELNIEELISKLSNIYKPLLALGDCNLITETEVSIAKTKLTNREKSHLYLIFKEIINNALKYAQAKNVFIITSKGNKRLKIIIEDDGVGIKDFNKGYGLKNIENRAKEINYKITRNSDDTGTSYVIEK